MSPEQARGEKLDGRTDVFSLGVVLCEMVTGKRLFSAATRVEVAAAAQRVDDLLPENFKLASVPKELQRIIRKSLQHDRNNRYASAGELLEDLTKLKRRLENRTIRRVIGVISFAAIIAVALVVLAAFLSINEVWEEKILRDGHTAAVRRAVFSPDGRLLVSVSEDHKIIVWDFVRRGRLKTLSDHVGIVNTVAFSSDGKRFATGGEDQNVIIWDAARLEKETVLRHPGPVGCLSFSPSGNLLASSSGGNPGITVLWTTPSWQKIREFPDGNFYGNYLFLENNRRLIDHRGTGWDVNTGERLKLFDWEMGSWAEISPDGKYWATVSSDGKVKLIDLEQNKLLGIREGHHDHGRSVAYSPDGRWLATGAERVVLWDMPRFERVVPLEYESIVWSVAFSPDGKWLVSTHGDGAILVWDVVQREQAANLREHSSAVRGVALSNDGKQLASASEDKTVILWDTETNHKKAVLVGHRTRVAAVAFTSDGRWLASADQGGNVIRWDAERREVAKKIIPSLGLASYCVAISPNGRIVATSFAVYDFETGQPLLKENATAWRHVYSTVFSSDGRVLIGVNDRGEVILVDTETWQFIARHESPDLKLVAVSLSPDGRYLVTGEDSKTVRLWTVDPLRQVAVIGHHEARIKSVAFSPNGKQIASAGDDKMIALWDVDRRKLITRIGTHTSPIYAIAFSPDGQRLISGEHDRSVRIYTRHRELWGFPLKW